MNPLTITGIAVGLAMDALAVAIAVGCRIQNPTLRQYFRLSFHFGLFQALMPVLGWYLGMKVETQIANIDHWIAFVILAAVGLKMIYESIAGKGESRLSLGDPTRKWSLVILSLATSIDAFAVGLSLALIKVDILGPSLIIGGVALLFTALGMICGQRAGKFLGRKSELIGGVILVGIGLKVLIEHVA